jgi:hypothetical protein
METANPTKAHVIEVAILAGKVLVTFSDGRIAMLNADDLHLQSVEAPVEPGE